MNQLITFAEVSDHKIRAKSKPWLELSLSVVSKLLEKNQASLELSFYLYLVNALRIIALHILEKDNLRSELERQTWINPASLTQYNSRILNCFIDFAEKLGIILRQGEQICLDSKYSNPLMLNCHFLTQRLSSDYNYRLVKERISKHYYHEELQNFLHIYLLTSLKNKCSLSSQMLQDFGVTQNWLDLVNGHTYDMQLEMAEYTFELLEISLYEKIPSPRPDSYYTRLGKDAIKNLSQENFIELVEKLKVKHDINRVLDVGCGYGNYLKIFQEMKGFQKIYGVEMQHDVWELTTQKFQDFPEVEIINNDIFNIDLEQKVDLILLNFVLFYFSLEDKLKLLNKLKQLLSEQGVIVICQYYSHVEGIQSKLAQLKKDLDWEKYIQIYFASVVLYAEVLLNETINAFQASEQWEELLVLLQKAGLRIKYVTNADSFYYSFFIVIEKDDQANKSQILLQDECQETILKKSKRFTAKDTKRSLITAFNSRSRKLWLYSLIFTISLTSIGLAAFAMRTFQQSPSLNNTKHHLAK